MSKFQETIEGLRLYLEDSHLITHCRKNLKGFEKDISTAIGWGEALERAEGELPKKRELSHIEDKIKEIEEEGKPYSMVMVSWRAMLIENKAINQVIDIARPILAKAILENKELAIKYDKLGGDFKIQSNKAQFLEVDSLQRKIKYLEKRIQELTK